jgi:hypothetical protein
VGTGDYPVELQRRLQALRRDHPELEIDVDLESAGDELVVVKATVRQSGAGAFSSLGAVSGEPSPMTIEQAELRAVERALSIVFPPPVVTEAPRPSEPTPISRGQSPAPERRNPAPIRTNAPIDISANRPPQAQPQPSPTRPASASARDETSAADFSWTAFWNWARENGFTKKEEIEAAIGRSYDDLTPKEVRRLILEKRGR